MTDFSFAEAVLREQIYAVGEAWQRPSILYQPRIFLDGTEWCCLLGENPQVGVCAFGKTPYEATNNFDYYAWYGKPVPQSKQAEGGAHGTHEHK